MSPPRGAQGRTGCLILDYFLNDIPDLSWFPARLCAAAAAAYVESVSTINSYVILPCVNVKEEDVGGGRGNET